MGSMAVMARDEYRGAEIARDLVNAAGGVHGHKLVFVTRDLEEPGAAAGLMAGLRKQGVTAVLGAYSSALSIPAAYAADHAGLLYWEEGAVADRVTGQGLANVFRVGASGSDLGANSARFLATQLAPRLGVKPSNLRISIVSAVDDYATSVASAVVREARVYGMTIAGWNRYDEYAPDWQSVLRAVRAQHPDILVLASHIPDGIAFRRAFLAARIYVKAFIGSTMAQCEPDFGNALGKQAIGVFASDRPSPMGGFSPKTLDGAARTLYNRLVSAWRRETGQTQPTEEAVAGFTAAWVLFHDVLPAAHSLTPSGIAAAARSLNLPAGSLPNGGGVLFARDRAHLGQNLRASAVIWQWQGVRHSVVVWPRVYATGQIRMVPLPR
jgi:branched-chain amino acid transport system substrate-binding protein